MENFRIDYMYCEKNNAYNNIWSKYFTFVKAETKVKALKIFNNNIDNNKISVKNIIVGEI